MNVDISKVNSHVVVALAGNPNVGKSTLFNALTGMRQHTGNWPGKTVSGAVGQVKYNGVTYRLVDLPGAYSLSPRSAEEEVTRDFIAGAMADIVVVVCDATCLERNLILLLQIMKACSSDARIILCVNLMDEAKRKGISVDFDRLSHLLGISVVGTVAKEKSSITALMDAISGKDSSQNSFNSDILALDNPSDFAKASEYLAGQTVRRANPDYQDFDRRIDKIFTGRLLGYPSMVIMLLLILWITISLANYPSELLSAMFSSFQQPLSDFIFWLGAPDWLHDMLVFGLYRVMTWVISVMLPPMAIFFPLFTLLEDIGYLPRVAYNLDKCFRCCNACGKQALTMCMGFGCNAVGVTGCRIIDSPRERLIGILTNNFVPCNGRFPTLIALITIFFVGTSGDCDEGGGLLSAFLSAIGLTCILVLGIAMTFLSSKLLSVTVLKGLPSSFVLELPPYRRPKVFQVICRSMLDRTIFVLARAVAFAAPAGILIWIMANVYVENSSLLSICTGFLDPFAELFGMDGVIMMAFILGLPANEIVLPIILMAYLSQGYILEYQSLGELKMLLEANGWTWLTALCTMLFSLMHWPCSTTLITIYKETKSVRWTAIAFLLPTFIGLCTCFIVYHLADFVKYIMNYML